MMDIQETTTVFYADDDRDDLDIFLEVAKNLNLDAHPFESADSLIEGLNEATKLPSLIFLDLNMPIKSGYEALEEIKGLSRFAAIPVVILSTASNTENIARCEKLGADLYICKPNSIGQLTKAIEHSLAIDFKRKNKSFEYCFD